LENRDQKNFKFRLTFFPSQLKCNTAFQSSVVFFDPKKIIREKKESFDGKEKTFCPEQMPSSKKG